MKVVYFTVKGDIYTKAGPCPDEPKENTLARLARVFGVPETNIKILSIE